MQSAECRASCGDDCVLVSLVSGVACHTDGVIGAAELLDGLGERLRLARGDDDPGALVDETLRDAEPDAPARSGDDGHRALVRAHQKPRSRPMSSFMISFEPAQIFVTRASRQARATRYSFMKP